MVGPPWFASRGSIDVAIKFPYINEILWGYYEIFGFFCNSNGDLLLTNKRKEVLGEYMYGHGYRQFKDFHNAEDGYNLHN